eukprot:jgi/Chlat1/6603/Chrsp46S06094
MATSTTPTTASPRRAPEAAAAATVGAWLAAAVTAAVVAVAVHSLLAERRAPNPCHMSYMSPEYLPVELPAGTPGADKYSLHLYKELGVQAPILLPLAGVPALYVPGSGGSFRQIRSLAAETAHMAVKQQHGFTHHLDFFSIHFEDELGAFDAGILREQTEFVVSCIKHILSLYTSQLQSLEETQQQNHHPPATVLLVGHSMGGLVARAAVVHPHLPAGSVHTLVTLATPHTTYPFPAQAGLAAFYASTNRAWLDGFRTGLLHDVVTVSVAGGERDEQVRAGLTRLEGLLPSDNAVSVTATAVPGVWVSADHQCIMWCNQLVRRLSYALLKLVDHNTGQLDDNRQARHSVLKDLLGGHTLHTALTGQQQQQQQQQQQEHAACRSRSVVDITLPHAANQFGSHIVRYSSTSHMHAATAFDVADMLKQGRTSFVFLTNLRLCLDIRVHLWPEAASNESDAVEMTTLAVQFSEPVPGVGRPVSMLIVRAEQLSQHRWLTVSLGSSVRGWALTQFFHPDEGHNTLRLRDMMLSRSMAEPVSKLSWSEGHPAVVSVGLPASPVLLPLRVEVNKGSGHSTHSAEDYCCSAECECFAPMAILTEPMLDEARVLQLRNNKFAKVTSDAPLWDMQLFAGRRPFDAGLLFLIVDPMCTYELKVAPDISTAIAQFFLSHARRLATLAGAVTLLCLAQQARHVKRHGGGVPSLAAVLHRDIRRALIVLVCAGVIVVVAHALDGPLQRVVGQHVPLLLGQVLHALIVTSLLFYIAAGIVAIGTFAVRQLVRVTSCCETTVAAGLMRTVVPRKAALSNGSGSSRLSAAVLAAAFAVFVLSILASFTVHATVNSIVSLAVLLLAIHQTTCRRRRLLSTSSKERATAAQRWEAEYALCNDHRQALHAFFLLYLWTFLLQLAALVSWLQRPRLHRHAPNPADALLTLPGLLHSMLLSCSSPHGAAFAHAKTGGVAGVYTVLGVASLLLSLGPHPHFLFFATAVVGLVDSTVCISQLKSWMEGYWKKRQ